MFLAFYICTEIYTLYWNNKYEATILLLQGPVVVVVHSFTLQCSTVSKQNIIFIHHGTLNKERKEKN